MCCIFFLLKIRFLLTGLSVTQLTAKRTLPYFQKEILPKVLAGQNVLIVAHGNSNRSIIMDLEKLTPDEVVNLELATGIPIVFKLNGARAHKDQV